jgi:hypothetical protein
MKTQKLALIAILALPLAAGAQTTDSTATTAVENLPAGILGENYVGVFGSYGHTGYSDSTNTDFSSQGFGLNYNLYSNQKFGVDANFNYEYTRNNSSGAGNYYRCNAYTLGVTGFYNVNSLFSPFVTVTGYADNSAYIGVSSADSKWFASRIGVETHVAPGWYVTPSVILWQRINASDPTSSACADWSLEGGHWFTKHFQAYVSANYREIDSTEETWYVLGARVRF